MFAEAVSQEFAAQIEACEVSAWLDMYAAAPANFARQFQLEILQVENIVLTRCKLSALHSAAPRIVISKCWASRDRISEAITATEHLSPNMAF
jgi:hypothetical protein